ncbi:lysozyme inhibitor LprI family protein [Elstera litoralis]|uniref:lysozyme inhibitor LprI family protein n=1 Tax=Elstera litoralis TaxID=552518 RepID=UPI000698DAA3|nr:lysozyme inhibitor LprI family protein [Elstera litoralis]
MKHWTFKFFLSVILITPWSHAQAAPSFDCAKASTEVEKSICASPDLSKADVALAAAYRNVIARAPEEAKPLLRSDQRGWLAHVGKICQARWAPKEGGEDYVKGCIGTALSRQTDFYRNEALLVLPNPYGVLLARQSYRSAPVAAADQIDHLMRIRAEANRFPQFLAPALKVLSAAAPKPGGDDAFETDNAFKASLYRDRLLVLDYTTYTYAGGAHGLYGSDFAAIDLARARKLTAVDVFRPNTAWRAALAREAEKSLRVLAKREDWEYEPLTVADMTKAVGEQARWVPGANFGVYFGLYEVGPYAIGTPIAQISYADLRDYLTPEFKSLIGLD